MNTFRSYKYINTSIIERTGNCYHSWNPRSSSVWRFILVIKEVRKLARNFKRPSNKMQHIFNSLITEFKAVHFLHILRTNNHSVDYMANKGIQIEYGFTACDGNSPDRCWIPWQRSSFDMYNFCILILEKFIRVYSHSRYALFRDKYHHVKEEQNIMVLEVQCTQSINLLM